MPSALRPTVDTLPPAPGIRELEYIPELDGLRGVAIALVALFHVSRVLPALQRLPLIANGWMGVDLFFVISGFLITRILFATAHRPDRMKRFYSRRIGRIHPIYLVLVAFVFVVLPAMAPSLRDRIFSQCAPWPLYLIFAQNLIGEGLGFGPVSITWSLCIEEQFYLIWPQVVFHLRREWVRRVCVAILLLSPGIRLLALHVGFSETALYTHTFSRLDGLAAGAWIACGCPAPLIRGGGWIGLLGVIATVIVFPAARLSIILRYSFIALLFFGIVGWGIGGSGGALWRRLLTHRLLLSVGRVSYGIYVCHLIVIDALTVVFGHFHLGPGALAGGVFLLLAAGITYGIARLSWRWFESPLIALARQI